MPTPSESRAALALVTGAAVEATTRLLGSLTGSGERKRADLLGVVPEVIAYYSDGSSALAADFYDDERAAAGAAGLYLAEPVVLDRSRKIGNAIAWASEPLFAETADAVMVTSRLAEVVQLETARPYRDTILTNRRRDPEAVGWRRVASGDGCKFCRLLADKGAIFREDTVRFASHPHCSCSAWPAFRSNDDGVSADVMQYVASKRTRTPAEKRRLREYINAKFPDAHG